MKKKVIFVCLIVVLSMSILEIISFSSNLSIQLTNIKLFINGTRVDKEVYIVGESSYLPIRAISEALDLEVEWDESNRAIKLSQKPTISGDEIL